MDVVKKNIVSVICGVIAIVACIAYIWPLGSWVTGLANDTKQRAAVYSQLETLRNKTRHLPNISIENTEQLPLTQFPSQPIIDEGGNATKRVHLESETMRNTAVQLNSHKPLLDGVLPVSGDTLKFRFKYKYGEAMEQTIPRDVLKAGTPPDHDDLDKAADALWKQKFANRVIMVNGQPDAANQKQVEEEYTAEVMKLPLELRTQAATSHKIYLSPGALTMHQAIAGGAAPAPVDIWTAQLRLWVQEDIARAIAAANADATGIPDAPVKHLIKITVPDNFVGGVATAPGEEPAQNGPIPKNTAMSPTGRMSNPLYDVMLFELELNVDATRVPFVLHKLSENQFVTINEVNASSVDSAAAAANGYVYGSGPVVHLNLKCEMLFMRDWMKPLMPDVVKARLHIPLTEPGQQPSAAAQ